MFDILFPYDFFMIFVHDLLITNLIFLIRLTTKDMSQKLCSILFIFARDQQKKNTQTNTNLLKNKPTYIVNKVDCNKYSTFNFIFSFVYSFFFSFYCLWSHSKNIYDLSHFKTNFYWKNEIKIKCVYKWNKNSAKHKTQTLHTAKYKQEYKTIKFIIKKNK